MGGLDAVQAGMVQEAREVLRLPAELLHVGHETQCNGKTVTLTLTADEETTNGLITLEYDSHEADSDGSFRQSTAEQLP